MTTLDKVISTLRKLNGGFEFELPNGSLVWVSASRAGAIREIKQELKKL